MLKISPFNFLDREFSERHYILKTLKTPNTGRILARSLIITGGIFLIFLFLPWQQNIRGTGEVTAFTPENRPQTIESTIAGRIASWNVREGQYVNKGDTILTLTEVKEKFFDPQLLTRLQEQITAKEQSIEAKKGKIIALKNQIAALRDGFEIKQRQARNKLVQTKLKLVSDSVDFEAEKIRFSNAESLEARNRQLYEAGNITLSKFQEVESKFQESKMKLISAENTFMESQTEVITARIEIAGVAADYQDKISKAESDLNTTYSDLAEKESELAKLRNEYANMEIRNQQYQVIAPQEGYIVKAVVAGIGETIKEGEAVATIMPSSPDVAVAMYVKAMDVPLLEIGRHVRIEFDGWPALQFSGWPSVAVGTFGGTVQVIDFVNSKDGKFRILVTPDPNDEPWPEQLRLGSGTKGWVMLDTVPVWYEIWRQLNGFPPSLYSEPESDTDPSKSEKS
jgi:multidrug resistance efflux pump